MSYSKCHPMFVLATSLFSDQLLYQIKHDAASVAFLNILLKDNYSPQFFMCIFSMSRPPTISMNVSGQFWDLVSDHQTWNMKQNCALLCLRTILRPGQQSHPRPGWRWCAPPPPPPSPSPSSPSRSIHFSPSEVHAGERSRQRRRRTRRPMRQTVGRVLCWLDIIGITVRNSMKTRCKSTMKR